MDLNLLQLLDGFAGLAALVNSLFMWPIVKSLSKMVKENHGPRLAKVEAKLARRKRQR